jgi:hypothetical protein
MLSPKRLAQLGLGSASFVLVASVAVLLAGSSDLPAADARANDQTDNRSTALTPSPIATVSATAITPSDPANGH